MRALRDAMQRLFLPDRADPARHALPARLVAEERGDAQDEVAQVDGVVEHHDDAGSERRARRRACLRASASGRVRRAGRTCRPRRRAAPLRASGLGEVRPPCRSRRGASCRTALRRRRLLRRGRTAQNRRVPVDCGVPTAANAAPPSRTMRGTLASVSTLLTTVGLPKRPACTGNGGLLRGSPRLPSIDSKSAVSSPQM